MGSWKYAYFFSSRGERLNFESVADFLFSPTFIPDRVIINMKENDEGQCVEYSTEKWDDYDMPNKITEKIKRNESLQLTYKGYGFFFNFIAAQCGKNPYMCFLWQYSIFNQLPADGKKEFMEMIGFAANASNAAYVVLLKDSPGFFEERFFYIDDMAFIDTKLSSGYDFKIDSIWVKENQQAPVLIGSIIDNKGKIENGYILYE